MIVNNTGGYQMVQNREEFGYPHEIISSSLRWATHTMEGSYSKRVKLLASVVLNLIDITKPKKIDVDEKDNVNHRILYHIPNKNTIKLKSCIGEHVKELERLLSQYEKRKNEPSLNELRRFIEESVLAFIVLKCLTNKELLKKDTISRIEPILSSSSIGSILDSISLLYERNKIDETTVNETINQFSSISEFPNHLYAIFLTSNLASKYPTYKSKFLFEHYRALRKSVSGFEMYSESKRLDDTALERLFVTAVILYLCGYQHSLRLPHEEKINYFEHIIARNTITNEFKKAFTEKACFNVWSLRIPLWIAVLIDGLLILIGIFWDLKLPAGLNLPILSVELPFNIPIFPVFAAILTFLIVFKIYRLKEYIIKYLRTGG